MDTRRSRRSTQSTAPGRQHGGTVGSGGGGEQVTSDFPREFFSRGAIVSHYQAFGGETGVNFPRESGTEQRTDRPRPSDTTSAEPHSTQTTSSSSLYHSRNNRPLPRVSSNNADRKRRLTTADVPSRRPSSIRTHSSHAGGTSVDPIVLGSSPIAPSRMSAPLPPLPRERAQSSTELGRRQSDLVLPRWQPDSEATRCPVCGRQFTFLFRKHHCRKCGRVVCSSCSPHRITMPRQFIVQPLSEYSANVIDIPGEDETTMSVFGPHHNLALGGGEEVRVCNPCVPDPNYSPPPQYHPAAARYSSHAPDTSSRFPLLPSAELLQVNQNHSLSSVHDASQFGSHHRTHRPRDSVSSTNNNRRVSYHGNSNSTGRWLPPFPRASSLQSPQTSRHDTSTSRAIPGIASRDGHPVLGLHSTSPSGSNSFSTSRFTTFPEPPPFLTRQLLPPRSRREIAEEDECPICGHELPPNGPEGDEEARTQHIEECITLHSAAGVATALTQQTSVSLPNQRTRGMSNPDPSIGDGAGNPNRLSHAARGMFPYIATEKECVDDEGKQAECIICLEDIESGNRMARLVCWCKFHEECIKDWWDKKGRGACPIHQLQE